MLAFGQDNQGVLCIQTHRALYRFKETGFEKLMDCPSNFPDYQVPFLQDDNGSFWFPGYDVDLFEFDGSNWTEHTNLLVENTVSNNGSVSLAPNGDIWRKFNYGMVLSFDGTTWTEIIGPNQPKRGAHLYAMEFDEYGNVWLGTNYGVMVYNPQGLTLDQQTPIRKGAMSIYPNPFANQLTLQLPQRTEEVILEVFNVTGQKVFEGVYTQTDRILLENLLLTPDFYVLRATTQDGNVYSERALLIHR